MDNDFALNSPPLKNRATPAPADALLVPQALVLAQDNPFNYMLYLRFERTPVKKDLAILQGLFYGKAP